MYNNEIARQTVSVLAENPPSAEVGRWATAWLAGEAPVWGPLAAAAVAELERSAAAAERYSQAPVRSRARDAVGAQQRALIELIGACYAPTAEAHAKYMRGYDTEIALAAIWAPALRLIRAAYETRLSAVAAEAAAAVAAAEAAAAHL